MNHDLNLKLLGVQLKVVLSDISRDIAAVNDPKHRIKLIQQYDKATHWMLKMADELDDLNQWLTAFGPKVEE